MNNVVSLEDIKNGTGSGNSDAMVFYGTKEVAEILHCSIPTAREIMRRKDFPLTVVGKTWLVFKKAFEEWAMQRHE